MIALGLVRALCQIDNPRAHKQNKNPLAALAIAFGLQNDFPMRKKSKPRSSSTKLNPRPSFQKGSVSGFDQAQPTT
jgi:hypothetical protein